MKLNQMIIFWVLFSGKMSKMNVFQGLKKINKTKNNLLIEILFHPGERKKERKKHLV